MDKQISLKTYEIRFRGPHPGLSEEDCLWLSGLPGIVCLESLATNRLKISYDLHHICLRGVLQLLAMRGLHLDASLWSKITQALIFYSEDAQREKLDIPIGTSAALRELANLREQASSKANLPDDPKHTTANNAWNRYL
jgi:hypothetical protein